jgi:putative ABC transport system permease protein
VAILILAVGIGANVAMFSITDAVMFQSLPFPESERLVLGRTTYDGQLAWNVSAPDYYDYRDRVEAFESFGTVRTFTDPVAVTGRGDPERVETVLTSVTFFPTLGVKPSHGRNFTAAEAELSAADVAIISHGYWQRKLGGSPDAVGDTLVMSGVAHEIVGIMPAGFFFLQPVDIWIPMRDGGPSTGYRQYHNWTVVGRLAPGVTLEQARSQVDVVAAQLEEAYPDSNTGKGLRVSILQDELVQFYRPMLLMLMAAVSLVLLIACGNVASLLLARGLARNVEMSVRSALGATARRLVQQLMIEGVLLAAAAGVAGILLGIWLQRIILRLLPLEVLGISEIGVSLPMVLFSIAISLATALVFGAAPAFFAARANPADNLKSGARTTSGGAAARLRSSLVILQVALSVVLLIGAGLLVRSFVRLHNVNPGFRPDRLLTLRIGIPETYDSNEKRIQFFTGLLDDIRAIPGVESAGAISQLPIKDGYSNITAWDPAHPPADLNAARLAEHRRILPGYFEAMDIPLLAGRDIETTDTADGELVLVINQAMALGLFQDDSPLGRQVALDWGEPEPALVRVVGVVGDVRMTSLSSEPGWQMYYSYRQSVARGMSLAIRTRPEPTTITRAVAEALKRSDPDIPLAEVSTMRDVLTDSLSETRVMTLALTVFASVALFLAAIGLYSVLAFYVVRHLNEIGIRLALGASIGRILNLVLGRGMVLVGIGLLVGIGGAFAVTRFIQQQLYGVEATDPTTFVAVGLLLALVGAAASVGPAWRAARLDPVKTLHAQ